MDKPLSPKQRAFIEHYVRSFNALASARAAGYTGSDATLGVQGARLLKNVNVKAAVEARLAELSMSPAEILTRLTDHARGSLEDFLTNGAVDLAKAEQRGKLHLLKSYRVSDKGAVYIELYDGQAALVQLGRAHGLFVDKQEVTARVDFSADDAAQAEQELAGWQP